jgi:hypothetical protein
MLAIGWAEKSSCSGLVDGSLFFSFWCKISSYTILSRTLKVRNLTLVGHVLVTDLDFVISFNNSRTTDRVLQTLFAGGKRMRHVFVRRFEGEDIDFACKMTSTEQWNVTRNDIARMLPSNLKVVS